MESAKIVSPGNWFLSARFRITALLAFGIFVSGLCRVNISMALVCMVNSTAIELLRSDKSANRTPLANLSSTLISTGSNCALTPEERSEYDGELIWSSHEQKWIFASVHIGQILVILPAGRLADRFGPKTLMFASVAVSMVVNLLTPMCAQVSYALLVGLRIAMGLAQAFMTPCIAATVARWVPPDEKATVSALYTAGNQLCIIAGMPLFGWLCSMKSVLGGWPSIFYLSGILGVPWCFLWLITFTNAPRDCKYLSTKELEFINYSLKDQNLTSRKQAAVPWRKLLTSKALWSCNVSLCASAFAVHSLQNYLPKYFKDVLYLNLKRNGLFNALPYASLLVVKTASGYLSDVIKKRSNFSRTAICKAFNSSACFGLAVFLVGMSFLDCQHADLAIFLLCIGKGLSSGFLPGARVCLAHMSPQHAGTVQSIASFQMMLAAIVTPYLVSPITASGTREAWQIVFFSVSAILVFGGVVFLAFGSGELQHWAKLTDTSDTQVDEAKPPLLQGETNLDADELVVTRLGAKQ